MPIGNAYATGNIVAFIDQYHLKNKRLNVLDIGCGIGHNGFIFREMFEIRYSRLKPKEWMHRVEAIEIFEDYRNPIWDYVYDEVIVHDCQKAIPLLEDKKFDIIFATEVLEHFEKDKIHLLLDELIKKLTDDGSIIITIPLGEEKAVLAQKDLFGNVHETHRSYLIFKDFEKYNIRHKVNDGIFMIGRER
ncbi:MAG: class I SAM-dependent methyltransferase [Candidatus Omnitrophica bacterium]|nr:class I SAM-dependent methyltransferase [Candidatus Omnitrophota bacterium]